MARIKKLKSQLSIKTGKNDICRCEIGGGLVTITEQNENSPGKYHQKEESIQVGGVPPVFLIPGGSA